MYYLPFAVELVGTLIFLYVILASGGDAISIGIALAAVILFGGKLSGGHFNPAVSIMMYLNNKLGAGKLVVYIVAQVLGGAVALWLYNNRIRLSQ
jgi:glycerol uptake facilitator-like aquaporin